jgi:hypothetical protein
MIKRMVMSFAERVHRRDFHWIAVAALEAEPDGTLLEPLKASANKWRKRWLTNNTFRPGVPGLFLLSEQFNAIFAGNEQIPRP